MREKTQVNKIRDENGNVTTDTNEIQSTIWGFLDNFYSNKLKKNLKEVNF
jgi:hypothetical protein